MDTIEPPSFCPSLGFTAASAEPTAFCRQASWPFYCCQPLSVLPCAALRCTPIVNSPLIPATCSFLRWSRSTAWLFRCCRLLSPCGWPLQTQPPPAVCASRKVSGAQRHLQLHLSIHLPPTECLDFTDRQLTGTFWDFKLSYGGNVHRGAPPAADGRRERARSKDRLEPLYRPLIARACRNRTACAQHV